MTFSKSILRALSVVSLLFTVACASGEKQSTAGEYIDDSVITTRVKTAIIKDPELKATEINVETFKGEVQLSGFVSSKEDMNKAVSLTRSVEGVNSVKNDMRLR